MNKDSNTATAVQAPFPVKYDFKDAALADLLGVSRNPLDEYSDRQCWVAWKVVERDGKPTKVPLNPETGLPGSTSNPATWNTRGIAEKRMRRKDLPGVGIVLGDVLGDPEYHLAGIDLDSCFDPQGKPLPWAADVVRRFPSYAETSPSGDGMKLFFRVRVSDAEALLHEHGKRGFEFSLGSHTEMALYLGGRFFTVTGMHYQESPAEVAVADPDSLAWFINDAGPAFKTDAPTGNVDRSGRLMAIAHEMTLDGATFAEFTAAAMADPHAAGHVRDQGNKQRALRRAWDEAQRTVQRHVDSFEDDPELMTTPAPKQYGGTESGVALEFIDTFAGQYRFDHDRGCWFVWNGATWQPDTTRTAQHRMDNIAGRKAAASGRDSEKRALLRNNTTSGASQMAARNPTVAVTQKAWDADPWLLGTPGGTVDLRTGDIKPADPADHITKQAGAAPIPLGEFGAGQQCPRWLAFLHDATAGDGALIRYLQQWAGYMLTGDVRAEELLFIHGPGGGGKSTFLNTLAKALGDYAVSVPSDTLMVRRHEAHKTEIARLNGPRLAYCSEIPKGARWHENRIKELTGGDTMTGNFMRQDYFDFNPQLKLVIVGNNAPSLDNVDAAIRRRFNVIPFDNIPKVKDDRLKEKLVDELPAILSWAIEGALDWQRNGFVKPDSVKRATTEYLAEQDTFAQWLAECCERDPESSAATQDLLESWNRFNWQPATARDGLTEFSTKMRDHGFERKEKVRAADGSRKKGWSGLRLTSQYDIDDLL